jgi:hypothetical protein
VAVDPVLVQVLAAMRRRTPVVRVYVARRRPRLGSFLLAPFLTIIGAPTPRTESVRPKQVTSRWPSTLRGHPTQPTQALPEGSGPRNTLYSWRGPPVRGGPRSSCGSGRLFSRPWTNHVHPPFPPRTGALV